MSKKFAQQRAAGIANAIIDGAVELMKLFKIKGSMPDDMFLGMVDSVRERSRIRVQMIACQQETKTGDGSLGKWREQFQAETGICQDGVFTDYRDEYIAWLESKLDDTIKWKCRAVDEMTDEQLMRVEK